MRRGDIPLPFLKWAGGKGALLPVLLQSQPAEFDRYYEPFLGGGALFFGLYRHKLLRRAFLSDLNAELIETYRAIRDDPQAVMAILRKYPHEREFYYHLRSQDPVHLTLAERAARFIYLNKTCYNGLYRVNREGKFNVPFGRYKNPRYFEPENLLAVSQALRGVELQVMDFEGILEGVQPGDWVYLDPPYMPLSATASFTGYQAEGFTETDQRRLCQFCGRLTKKGVYFLLSNSDTPLIRTLYAKEGFSIRPVQAPRAIAQKAASRRPVQELLIANYPLPPVQADKPRKPAANSSEQLPSLLF